MEILQNGFCMIPNVVLYDNELSDKQKLLYWTISSLCAEKWYCWASNDYIWELLWVNKWTISKNIAVLEQKWYIHITLDSNYKRYIELNSIVENNNSCDNSQGGLWKITRGYCEKSQDININDKDNNIIINNNTELWDNSEILDNQNNSLSINNLDLKEKEKSCAKKEKENWNQDINNLISEIKNVCNELWVAYNKDMERQFSKHILTAKEYWEFCEKIWQTRVEFALNVLKVSVAIWFFRGALSWPKLIYKHYAELYNQAKQKSQKFQNASVDVL